MRLAKMVEELHQYCYLDKIIYYIKVHCVQAPLEAFIGLFLFVWAMISMDPSLLKNDSIVKIPLLYAGGACLLFLVGINCIYIISVKKIIAKNLKDEELFKEAETVFLIVSYIIHFLGIVSYMFVTILIVRHFYGSEAIFYEKKQLLIIGSFVGIIWNWRGYSGDRRIDCRKIFREIQHMDLDNIIWLDGCPKIPRLFKFFTKNQIYTVRAIKLKYTILHIATNLITTITVGVVYVYLVFYSIQDASLIKINVDIGNFNIGTYGFFVITFVFVFVFYLKTLYPLFYVQSKSIYCDFDQLLR